MYYICIDCSAHLKAKRIYKIKAEQIVPSPNAKLRCEGTLIHLSIRKELSG